MNCWDKPVGLCCDKCQCAEEDKWEDDSGIVEIENPTEICRKSRMAQDLDEEIWQLQSQRSMVKWWISILLENESVLCFNPESIEDIPKSYDLIVLTMQPVLKRDHINLWRSETIIRLNDVVEDIDEQLKEIRQLQNQFCKRAACNSKKRMIANLRRRRREEEMIYKTELNVSFEDEEEDDSETYV